MATTPEELQRRIAKIKAEADERRARAEEYQQQTEIPEGHRRCPLCKGVYPDKGGILNGKYHEQPGRKYKTPKKTRVTSLAWYHKNRQRILEARKARKNTTS